jgi:hypothetical protein
MITKGNYNKHIDRIGFENLPEELKKAHLVIMSKTDNGNDWKIYETDEEIKKVIDLSFQKLDEFIVHRGNENLSGHGDSPAVKQAKQDAIGYPFLETERIEMIYRLEKDAELEDGLTEEIEIRKTALEKELRKRGVLKRESKSSGKKYKNIRKEVTFIMRFLEFNDKVLYKKTFEIFLNDLQASIQKKEITKKSPVAKEIMAMQTAALAAFNTMKHAKHFVLSPATIKRLKKIIEMHENDYDDDYDTSKKKKEPLKGLQGIQQEEIPQPETNLMCSTDFANMHFDSIGFTGKWLELIGDPSIGFTVMVFGKPKTGKSYLCIDFAGYLASNHGKVLYVAKEEKLDATLQKKLNDKKVAQPNLFVSDSLPEDLSDYDFIFLDSVNKLNLSAKDLDVLRAKNPGKSFIFIFQTTKDGNFRGKNEFQHDVDVVIEIPERGKAVQFGRFNQGGEMNIFDEEKTETMELQGLEDESKLEGTKKKKDSKFPEWTEPEYLDKSDHEALKEIYRLYKAGNNKEAMNYAMDCDTVIREEIPGDIWKKMGGQLTKTGEEKLKAQKLKSAPEKSENKKSGIVFTYGVRLLKDLYENASERKLTDAQYIEILDVAENRDSNFAKLIDETHNDLMEFLTIMNEAIKEWDRQQK